MEQINGEDLIQLRASAMCVVAMVSRRSTVSERIG